MILKELKVKTMIEEPTNCYIIVDDKSKEAMVIDPAGNVEKIKELLDILKRKTQIYLFNTLSCRSYIRGYEFKKTMWWKNFNS